jgi:hypothetical protein
MAPSFFTIYPAGRWENHPLRPSKRSGALLSRFVEIPYTHFDLISLARWPSLRKEIFACKFGNGNHSR